MEREDRRVGVGNTDDESCEYVTCTVPVCFDHSFHPFTWPRGGGAGKGREQNRLLASALGVRRCRHMAYGIWHMAYGIWHMAYGIWHMAYGIWHMAYGICHTKSARRDEGLSPQVQFNHFLVSFDQAQPDIIMGGQLCKGGG